MTGLAAVFSACLLSGFAGVFFEKLLKDSAQPSVIVRNLQLGIFSIAFSGISLLYSLAEIRDIGIFYGYSLSVLTFLGLQSGGGLLIAATIKYADNILKGFATSISILHPHWHHGTF